MCCFISTCWPALGNVFKSEVCFVESVNPFCLVSALNDEQVAALIGTARRWLRANVLEDAGDTHRHLSRPQRRTTHRSDPSESLWVYGRSGEPCRRCGAAIRRRLQGDEARVTSGARLASRCRMALMSMDKLN